MLLRVVLSGAAVCRGEVEGGEVISTFVWGIASSDYRPPRNDMFQGEKHEIK